MEQETIILIDASIWLGSMVLGVAAIIIMHAFDP